MSTINPIKLSLLDYWIRERHDIMVKKEAGERKPWTIDPILQRFKFCNVKREDDAVTRWFADNWRHAKYWNEPTFVPAMMFGRTINWPDTLAEIGFPHRWEPDRVISVMDERQKMGYKVYTGAYMITAGPPGIRKNQWVVNNANSYFDHPPILDPYSLQNSWEQIIEHSYPCVGPFIAGQIIADLKQTKHLGHAKDWWDWAPVGPGSARGLNRLHDRPVNAPVSQKQGLDEMREVKLRISYRDICLQDVQNCLCEFDKYLRVKYGEGKPRSSYPGV